MESRGAHGKVDGKYMESVKINSFTQGCTCFCSHRQVPSRIWWPFGGSRFNFQSSITLLDNRPAELDEMDCAKLLPLSEKTQNVTKSKDEHITS